MPTEKGIYIEAIFSELFTDMKRSGVPAPEVIWVDDWHRWNHALFFLKMRHVCNGLLLRVVRKFWVDAATIIGQDWYHFRVLMLAHANQSHPAMGQLKDAFDDLINRVRMPNGPHGINCGRRLLVALKVMYNKFGPSSATTPEAVKFRLMKPIHS